MDRHTGTDFVDRQNPDPAQGDAVILDFDGDGFERLFRPPYGELATILDPALSCRGALWPGQRKAFVLGAGGLGVGGLFQPILLLAGLAGLLWAIFTCLIVWRLVLIVIGTGLRVTWRPPVIPVQSAQDFPVYSVMVAVFRETEIMAQLARALNQLVWPPEQLDVQILFEADDIATIDATDLSSFPPGTRFTIVPPGGLRTKANALNYGLTWARGEYVCIYDAEDRPHPGQLLEAHRAFQAQPDDLACAQAPLIGDNQAEAAIAAHWSLEYATQFGLLVPAMTALNLPVAIGGTSNHFRKDYLIEAGGWDAWNVTEDADLGLRLARYGRRVTALNLPTYEDAPATLPVWAAQRSRWIKGFIQTWVVLMRRPRVLLKQLGVRRFVALQLALGGAVIAPVFHAPLMMFVLLACLSSSFSLGALGAALLGAGLVVGLLGDVLAPGGWSWARAAAVLTRPLYWPLHSISAARAIWELATAPHFWAKTPHKPHICKKAKPCSTGLSA